MMYAKNVSILFFLAFFCFGSYVEQQNLSMNSCEFLLVCVFPPYFESKQKCNWYFLEKIVNKDI